MTILNLTYYENKAFLKQCTSSSFKVHFYFLGSVHSSSSWRVQLISLLYLHKRYYYKCIPDLLISLTNDHFIIHGHDWGVLITSLADAFITVRHDVDAWLHTHLARSLNSIWRIFKNVVWDTNVMHYYFIKRAQYKVTHRLTRCSLTASVATAWKMLHGWHEGVCVTYTQTHRRVIPGRGRLIAALKASPSYIKSM